MICGVNFYFSIKFLKSTLSDNLRLTKKDCFSTLNSFKKCLFVRGWISQTMKEKELYEVE